MTNYYEILGVDSGAALSEIKSAFRKLAKIYHPDKNPDGRDYFNKILKAYETLSDPVLKSSYDYKLNFHQAHPQKEYTSTQKKDTKQWRFDEKEMKRRQYYNEHIRKHAKEPVSVELEQKSNYNEYKYILFATPLAVILFLLIMKLAGSDKLTERKMNAVSPIGVKVAELDEQAATVQSSINPYGAYFGEAKYFNENTKLNVKNKTGADAIVCFFSEGQFVRSIYVSEGAEVETERLPAKAHLRYTIGQGFNPEKKSEVTAAIGGFSHSQKFYQQRNGKPVSVQGELVLEQGLNNNFIEISEGEFFKKENYD